MRIDSFVGSPMILDLKQSAVDKHSVMIVDSDGAVWRGYKQTFYHGQAEA